jgi:hypothetical protein
VGSKCLRNCDKITNAAGENGILYRPTSQRILALCKGELHNLIYERRGDRVKFLGITRLHCKLLQSCRYEGGYNLDRAQLVSDGRRQSVTCRREHP